MDVTAERWIFRLQAHKASYVRRLESRVSAQGFPGTLFAFYAGLLSTEVWKVALFI
jgi:hypothetical protein